MTIYGAMLPGAASLTRSAFLAGNLSERARYKLKVLDWLTAHGENVSLTARHFGPQRETVMIWRGRLAREGPRGLEDRSRRPRHVRQPRVAPDIVAEAVRLRKRYPAWSKYKIQPLLPPRLQTSESAVGRIIKRRGLADKNASRKRSRAAHSPKPRVPRGMKIACPGGMVRVDAKYLPLPGGKRRHQFTAIDVLAKQRALELCPTQSSRNGRLFLETCLQEFPFTVQAAQSDDGASFQKEFAARCGELTLPRYFAYPRSPQQNSYVEISHGADEREFYRQGPLVWDFDAMRARLKEWQRARNEARPHQALNYLTPQQYFQKWRNGRLPTHDIITLQT